MQTTPLLLTRPAGANADFARQFPAPLAARLSFVDCPLMRIVPLHRQHDIAETAAVIFTSSNGVRFAPASQNRRAYCIGERTTELARNAGWRAQCLGQTAAELVEALRRQRPAGKLLHLCGVHVRGEVAERLVAAGLDAERRPLYDQQLLPLTEAARAVLNSQDPVIVPLFSPRAAAHFAAVAPQRAGITLVCLSAAVADSIDKSAKFGRVTAPEPTARAVVSSIEKLASFNSLG